MSLDLHALMVFHNQRLSRELASRTMPIVVVETALVLLVASSAFFGNILVCLAIARNPRLRTPTNVLIFALSLTDITMSVSTMPLTIGVLASGRWIYTKGVCIFQGSFPLTLAVISLQLMVVIAVNRYLCVLKPNLYRRVFTLKKSIGFAVGVFVLACLPTLSPLIYAREGYQFHAGKSYCAFAMEQNFIFALCMGLAFIASPFIIMTCLYCRIYCLVKKRGFPPTRQRLSARKSSSAHSGSQGNKNTSSSSFWLFVLLVSHNDHRPNRYEQPRADVAETNLLHIRPSYLHVVCYKPDSVWTNETSVSRGVQENRNV